ncbi:hypothetical protein [Carboxylicivirga sp. N1Y90]|uniref:hypothetical protein n=1 Tax=Carboxylicivirga fragile TaxID=3417571 RepID=UPI003D355E00|nr:hypothetical protein [Marinilabiliaceae bacterium N1Y90]
MNKYFKITPPYKLVSYIFLQNHMTIFGLVILIIGQLISILDVSRFDKSCLLFPFSESMEIQGKVTAVNTIHYTFSNHYTYGYDYEVNDSNLGYAFGASFDKRTDLKEGDKVTVEYVKSDPSIHRIKGMRNSFVIDTTVIYLLVSLVGFIFLAYGLRNTRKFLKMVKNGYVTTASLSEKPTTNLIEGSRYIVLKFAFMTKGGQSVEFVKQLTNAKNILDDEEELIVYNENDPSQHQFVDRLPTQLKAYIYSEVEFYQKNAL